MKGSLLWKLMYVFCALAGVLAGYGVFTLSGGDEIKQNTNTKDNTLVRDAENSVFFDAEKAQAELPEITETPVVTEQPGKVVEPPSVVKNVPEITPAPTQLVRPTLAPERSVTPQVTPPNPENLSGGKKITPVPDDMPSLASQWVEHGGAVVPAPTKAIPEITEDALQSPATETITYPAEIFGQVPVINRSDTYVSYFEFAYDLINMLEPEVERRGLNMNSLLAKFVIKALFCGVDIAKLDINAPIPRRLAALCLWLAAQMLDENGCDTSAKSAQKYVTDISGCSSAEKKAVAYLYEQGILKGYQVAGQQFYPDAGLATESGSTWLSRIKQCWK